MRTADVTRHPLLRAMTRSLRSASVILTSPPPRGDPRARSGSLQLHSAQSGGGNQSGIWAKELAVVMTEEGASKPLRMTAESACAGCYSHASRWYAFESRPRRLEKPARRVRHGGDRATSALRDRVGGA